MMAGVALGVVRSAASMGIGAPSTWCCFVASGRIRWCCLDGLALE